MWNDELGNIKEVLMRSASLRRFQRTLLGPAIMSALYLVAPDAASATTMKCGDLAGAALGDITILSAQDTSNTLPDEDLVPSRGAHVQRVDPLLRNMPEFCRVKARLSPVKGSTIGVELWMPADWNGKLLGIGNHGFGGEFERGDMAVGLRRHYAMVTTDMGHAGTRGSQGGMNVGNAEFVVGNQVAIDDYAWRATHEMTVAAKVLVARYYGVAASKAYYNACSNGGRQAMREVQQFPADYDGVISGSAAMNWTGYMTQDLWQFQSSFLPSGDRLSLATLALVHRRDDRRLRPQRRAGRWPDRRPAALRLEAERDPVQADQRAGHLPDRRRGNGGGADRGATARSAHRPHHLLWHGAGRRIALGHA